MRIKIEKIVHGGYGLAYHDGGVLLIPFTVPGDTIDAVCAERGNPRFCWIKKIVEPSKYRIEPKCPNFTVCGGCDFQNIDYIYELEVKKGILIEDLKRLGGIDIGCIEDIDLIYAGDQFYRNNVQFKTDGEGKVGFFMKKSTQVVHIPEGGCLLVDEKINEFVLDILDGVDFKRGGFRVRSNRKGEVFKKGVPGFRDDRYCYYDYRDFDFRVDIDGFFQINNFLYEKWLDRVIEYIEPCEDDFVADLFSGIGFITIPVANYVRKVLGMEINGTAVKNALYNAQVNGVDNCIFKRVDVNRGFYVKEKPNKIVLDPPRAGISEQLIKEIVELEPEYVVYVSCDTSTYARDVGILYKYGMKIDKITLIDMFPRTSHIEVISRLVFI